MYVSFAKRRNYTMAFTDHKVRQFDEGSGPIFLDDLNCDGMESSLLDCRMIGLGLGIHNCDHSDDAGVKCSGLTSKQKLATIPIF